VSHEGAMTDTTAPAVATEAPAALPPVDKHAQVQTLLGDILRLMAYPARLELKDMPDGGIGVAVHFEGELPGITPGKRSYLVDCLQFLLNKVVNRPNTERKWVSLGVNGFPEPRPPQGQKPPAPPASAPPPAAAATPANGASAAAKPAPPKKDERHEKHDKPHDKPHDKHERHDKHEKHAHRGGEPDERSLEVAEDPAMTRAGKGLAEKSARLGRSYAVLMLSAEDRARLIKAAEGVKGVTVKAEGEAHLRRVVFTPEKPVPMPKRAQMPDYGDEEE